MVVHGVVQGVGFRPFVCRLAREASFVGHCGNDQVSVFIEVEGPPSTLDDFLERLASEAPPLSRVMEIQAEDIPVGGGSGFEIIPSRNAGGTRTLVRQGAVGRSIVNNQHIDGGTQ